MVHSEYDGQLARVDVRERFIPPWIRKHQAHLLQPRSVAEPSSQALLEAPNSLNTNFIPHLFTETVAERIVHRKC